MLGRVNILGYQSGQKVLSVVEQQEYLAGVLLCRKMRCFRFQAEATHNSQPTFYLNGILYPAKLKDTEIPHCEL